ncbi:hypothetical protein C8Q72DRAFT_862423 [Fomitopsis betulina]|nr:hypothetical protein C8Q72DRAFT_862423 [Fomitopsis betulina]
MMTCSCSVLMLVSPLRARANLLRARSSLSAFVGFRSDIGPGLQRSPLQDLVLRSLVAPHVLSQNKRLALSPSYPRLSHRFGDLTVHAATSRASLLSPDPSASGDHIGPSTCAFTNIQPKFAWGATFRSYIGLKYSPATRDRSH